MSGPVTQHAEDAYEGFVGPERQRMPVERNSLTHKVVIDGQHGYVTAGMYPDGSLGELFIHGFGKEGSSQVGWINAWCISTSIALQHGATMNMLARKFHHVRFEPNGRTDNPRIPECKSVPDYVFKWLAVHFGDEQLQADVEVAVAVTYVPA